MFKFVRRLRPKTKKRLLICTGLVVLTGVFVTSMVWYTMGPVHRQSRPMAYMSAKTDIKGAVVLPGDTSGGGQSAQQESSSGASSFGTPSAVAAPEPASLMLLAPAFFLLGKRRNRNAA